MNAIHRILTVVLALVAASAGYVGRAQDDAYLTPSRAKVERREAKKAYDRAMAKEKAEEARRDSIRALRAKEQDEATDWYNRRGMRVTIEDMERNLDRLDSSSGEGGKYSARMRRFNGEDDGRIVLNDVEKVYIMDDYRYDPRSRSYYGRGWDRDRDVFISICTDPWYGYDAWSFGWGYPSYYPWYGPYYGRWHLYDPWYGPWYDPRYPLYGPSYAWGAWGTWGYPYYGYAGSYLSGYYDGWYSKDYADRYTPSARRTESYYDRHASLYGRALGQGNVSRWSARDGASYSRSAGAGSVRSRRPVVGASRSVGTGNTRRAGESVRRTGTRSYNPVRRSSAYTPSRSTTTRTTTTTTTTRHNGTGSHRR